MCSWLTGNLTTGWREKEISGQLIEPLLESRYEVNNTTIFN